MKPIKKMWLKLFQLIAFVSFSVTVSAQLHADFSATPSSGCTPLVVNFTDISTGNPTAWKWDLGNGTVAFAQNPSTSYFDPGTYTVKLVVQNANGVDSVVRTKYIVVNASPVVSFKASDSTGCFPLKVNFTDFSTAGSGTISSWQWDFGDGTLSTLQNPSHIYTNGGTFTVTLRVVNSNGCVKVYTKPSFIFLSEGVKANFSFAAASGCQSPTPVTFSNTSTGTGALKYNWTFGDGNTSTQTNPVNNYTTAGTYSVKLVATNTSGCADTLVKPNAVVIGFVKAGFTFNDKVCVGAPVNFTNTSKPNTVSSTWYFSDGTVLTDINPVKTFTTAGVYQVKLVNDFGSCKDSLVQNVTILGKPTASFTATNTAGCKTPLIVSYQNTSTNGASYLWTFGDGTTSTQQSPTHTYTVSGSYTVSLVVTNASGCTETITQTDLVKIIPPRIITIDNLMVKGCLPTTVSPVPLIQSAQTVTSYFWDFGDGFTSTAATPSHTYTVPGAYNVKLKIVTNSGCTDSFSVTKAVMVGNKPTAMFEGSPRDICADIPVLFTDTSKNNSITDWLWTFGDGGTSILQNPKHPYIDTGRFTVSLVVTQFGCSDTLKIKNYIHISPPIAAFDTSYSCNDRLTRKFIDKSIGAIYYSWDFGDGTTSTDSSPTHTYAAPGLYTVVLTVSNGSCQNIKKHDVKVVKEAGVLSYGAEVLCRNSRVGMTVNNIDKSNIQNYTWYFNGMANGDPVTTVSVPIAQTYVTSGTYPLAVVTYDVLGCRDTLTASVPINVYGPKAGIKTPVPAACFGATTTFIDNTITDNVHPVTNYYWSYGDGKNDTLTGGPFLHKYDTAGVFNVSLLIVDTYGCRDSINLPALVTVSNPKAGFTISDTLVCPNSPIILTNTSTGGVQVNYNWNFGDGQTSPAVNEVHKYPQGNYKISMNMLDKYGCKDSMSTNVRVFPAIADFKMSDSFSSCPPLLVHYTNQSKNFVAYSWDFGDGGRSNLDTPSHLYTYPGIYTVKLWVNNNGGCSDTLKKTVRIQGPTGTFKYDPLTICNPSQINFIATTKNTVRYFWDFNDGTGNYTNDTTASHTYTTPGSYLPKMILEDASGCPVPIVGPDSIKVNAIKTNILAKSTVMCDSGYVAFSDSTWTNDAIGTFLWEFGDGTKSTDRVTTHQYTQEGIYNVRLTATSKFGCTDVAVLDNAIKIKSSPVIDIAGINSACEPAILTFNGAVVKSDTAAITWSWDMGNGQKSNLQDPGPQTYLKAGDYPVMVTATNSDGCKTSAEKVATIHPIPVVNAGPDTVMCKSSPIMLQPSGAATYTWDFDPSLSCLNCATPLANASDTTMYKVTGKTAFGCTNRDSLFVTVKQPFKMTVFNGDTLCAGSSYLLKAGGAQLYQWSPSTYLDKPTSATPRSTPDNTITYTVIGKDDRSCFADTGSVTIKVYPIPKIEINGSNPRTLNVGSSMQLTTTNSSDITSWKWYPGATLSCVNCPNPIASPKEAITYSVQATNDGGCTAKDDVTITVICDNTNVFVPNTFSPNGDGMNDYFFPRSNGVFSVKSFKVFNRWGQIVFQKNNINSNVASEGWDGKLNGVKLTPDVYVYCIEVVCANSATFPIIGNVTLIR